MRVYRRCISRLGSSVHCPPSDSPLISVILLDNRISRSSITTIPTFSGASHASTIYTRLNFQPTSKKSTTLRPPSLHLRQPLLTASPGRGLVSFCTAMAFSLHHPKRLLQLASHSIPSLYSFDRTTQPSRPDKSFRQVSGNTVSASRHKCVCAFVYVFQRDFSGSF